MAEEKHCPKCGTRMGFRLGEYECPQCGHYEAQIREAQQAREPAGPGFKQPWQGGATRPGAVPPPPPAPGTLYQPGQQFASAGRDGYSSVPQFDLYPSLNTEMAIYFGLHVAVGVALIVVLLAFGGLGSSLSSTVDMSLINALIGFVILVALLRLAVIWFVLYGSVIWAKWCCGGCTVVGILASLPGLFAVGAAAFESQLIGLIDVGLSIWFLTIVYRDIQRRQTL